MPDSSAILADLRRYADLLAADLHKSALAQPFTPETENDSAIQVERGLIFPRLLLSPTPGPSAAPPRIPPPSPAHLLASSPALGAEGPVPPRIPPPDLSPAQSLIAWATLHRHYHGAVVDRAGHARPVYRPLLVYCFLQAYRLAYETLPRSEFGRWEEAGHAWSDMLEERLGEMAWSPQSLTGPGGSLTAETCWIALALYVAGKVFVRDAWTDLASDTFGRLVHGQQSTGAFLASQPSDNPETLAYHERVILHAAASYAVQAEDRAVAAAVAANSRFQQDLLQPDHASPQPWAIFAFIWNAPTRPLADTLLHNSAAAQGAGLSWMLLGDALYCLRLFQGAAP